MTENYILIHNVNCVLDGLKLEPNKDIISIINDDTANNMMIQIKYIL